MANSVKDYSKKVNDELKTKASVSDVNKANRKLAHEVERGIKKVSNQNAIIDNELKLKALKDANKQKRKDFIKGPEKKDDK